MTPPRAILLVNAGQRDVQEHGALLPNASYRAETARLLDIVRAAPSDPHPTIGLPIIEATVRAIIDAGDGPIAVAIFGTDQNPREAHHAGDTVHAAAIMAALLPTRFPADVITAVALPLGVAKANDHDAAYRAFREVFREAKLAGAGRDARGPDPARAGRDAHGPDPARAGRDAHGPDPARAGRDARGPDPARAGRDAHEPSPTLGAIIGENPDAPVIIAVSSGTPAANLGALLAATETLGDRVRAIQPREDGTVARIDVATTIRRQALTQPALRLLTEGQFATAAAFIEAWGDRRATPIARLARALHKWQDYDLTGALGEVRNARFLDTVPDAPKAILINVVETMTTYLTHRVGEIVRNPRAQRPEPTTNQVIDLLWGADLCRRQGRLVDLVARAARLNEAIVRRSAARACGVWATTWSGAEFWSAARLRLGHRAAAFQARLAPSNPKASPWTWLVSVPNLLHLLDVLAEDAVAHPDLPTIAAAARIVDVARDLHNQSIAGHAFVGVTDHAIRDLLGQAVPSHDADTRARLGTEGEGGHIIVEAMARLLEAARMPAPRTNFFLNRFGVGLADALVAIDP
jgi:hypothetical protein